MNVCKGQSLGTVKKLIFRFWGSHLIFDLICILKLSERKNEGSLLRPYFAASPKLIDLITLYAMHFFKMQLISLSTNKGELT
ncbi:hypothetical protein AWQ24_07540 [Picosynechococcus sp. PCC 8807]|nr:hypothetical protein AWQ24_07540 [Picosynechococcus sp. PCC 8807]